MSDTSGQPETQNMTNVREHRVQSCTYWSVTELGGDHELGGDCGGSFVHRPDV